MSNLSVTINRLLTMVGKDRLRKLDLHGDFVKGVTWDPVGNFLATQVSVDSQRFVLCQKLLTKDR